MAYRYLCGPVLTAAVLLYCLVQVSCSGGLPDEFPAPDGTIKNVFTGRDISLSSFKGRYDDGGQIVETVTAVRSRRRTISMTGKVGLQKDGVFTGGAAKNAGVGGRSSRRRG